MDTSGNFTAITEDEGRILVEIASHGLGIATGQVRLETAEALFESLPDRLAEPGACFVTLRKHGELRGCTGTLEARQPLAREVLASTIQTATNDPRFEPVTPGEAPEVTIEISVLSKPQLLRYKSPADLLHKLRPGRDGVTLQYGPLRATFLPQVWGQIPDPAEFLSRLCEKMRLSRSAWMTSELRVETYEVQEIE